MDKRTAFLMLVQTATLERALKIGDLEHDTAAPALALAMTLNPKRIPNDLNHAVFEFIEWAMCGGARPEWFV